MKKIITALAVYTISIGMSVTSHAAEILDRDYIESEIWEDMWIGKDDNGTDFPEASYKHHLLMEWLDENYGSDEYDWSEIGGLKYGYRDYYNDYIEKTGTSTMMTMAAGLLKPMNTAIIFSL